MQSLEDNKSADVLTPEVDISLQSPIASIPSVDEASNCLLVTPVTSPEPVENVKRTWQDGIPQILACLAGASIVIQAGVNMSYSAVLLPQLLAARSNIHISSEQGSWIASLVTISTPFGSIMSGSLMDKMGRKAVCKLTCVPLILSWIIVAFVTNVHALYFARVLAGFGSGLSTAALMYISEVSHPTLRPMLLCLNSVFVSLGILLTCTFGLWMGYQGMAMTFAVLSLLSYMVTWPLPESPYWLASVKSMESADKALRWLNRRESCYRSELQRLMANSKNALTPEKINALHQCKSNITKRSVYKPLAILVFIFLFQQLSGSYVVIFYAVNLFQTIGGDFGSGVDEYTALVLLGVIRFIMSIFASLASRKFGRRPLCMISGIGMAISALIAALYLNSHNITGSDFFFSKYQLPIENNTMLNGAHLIENNNADTFNGSFQNGLFLNNDGYNQSQTHMLNSTSFSNHLLPKNSTVSINETYKTTNLHKVQKNVTVTEDLEQSNDHWIPLACILLFVSFSALGFLVIPWTLSGELLPIKVRGTCAGFTIAYAYVLMFVVVKTFPFALDVLQVDGVFFFFSAMSLSGAIFVFIFLPETLGKSFQEIEDHFEK